MNNNNDFPVPEIDEDELLFIDKMYAFRELYWSHYTWQAQTSYLKIIEKKQEVLMKRGIDLQSHREQISSIFSKINGSFYHLQRLKENEQFIIDLGTEVAKKGQTKISPGTLGMFGANYEPIGYEYEAVLVTLKSALDVLAIILSSIIGSKSDDVLKLANEMEQVKKVSGFKTRLKHFFSQESHKRLIAEFKNNNGVKSRRNYAVHIGTLSTGTINLQFVSDRSELGVIKSKAMPTTPSTMPLPKEKDLDSYCTTLFYDVSDMIVAGLELILEETLSKGEKKSIFEIKRLKNEKT